MLGMMDISEEFFEQCVAEFKKSWTIADRFGREGDRTRIALNNVFKLCDIKVVD